MKNKICLPKKIIQIFCLFFLIIGIAILANFINKTVLLSQNALATYSCSVPNQEFMRTDKQMCYEVCKSHGGYLKQDFNALKCCCKGNGTTPTETPKLRLSEPTPTTTSRPSNILTPTPSFPLETQPSEKTSCVFNPSLTCPAGTTKVTSSGFCGCVANQTVTTKRCVAASYLLIINHPARVEEYKDGRWQTAEECINGVCDPNTFQCTTIIPTGTKPFGEKCSQGQECQSGECASVYTEPSGRTIYLFGKKCVYSISQQSEFVEKKGERDAQTAEVALAAAVITSPIVRATYSMTIKYGIPTAANYFFQELQQPGVQNTLAAINVASTMYALSDCAKKGATGTWCNMLAAVASGNPGQFGLALGNDLSTLRTSAIETFRSSGISSILRSATTGRTWDWIKKAGQEGVVIQEITLATELKTVIPYRPNSPVKSNNWPIGETFPSNRGGTVVIDGEIGSGGLGTVYSAILYEPNMPPKLVVIKFPKNINPAEVVVLQSEQYLLAKGYNALPANLRPGLAKPYGYVTVKTNFGSAEFPVIENFGPGNTLANLIRKNYPNPTYLNKTAMENLLQTSKILDDAGIPLRDVMINNVWVTNDGKLILYDPFVPRFNPNTNTIVDYTIRRFGNDYVTKFGLNTNNLIPETLSNGKIGWQYVVPTGNSDAVSKMLQLFGNLIRIK